MDKQVLISHIETYLENIITRINDPIKNQLTEYDWRECAALIYELQKYKTQISAILNDKETLIMFYEDLQASLDDYPDKIIDSHRETLQYWNPNEDFSKMDKLTIIYRYAKLP